MRMRPLFVESVPVASVAAAAASVAAPLERVAAPREVAIDAPERRVAGTAVFATGSSRNEISIGIAGGS